MNVDQVTNAGVKAFPNTSNEVVTLGLTWNLNYTKSVIKSPLHPQRNGSIVCAITHDNQSKYKRTPALFSACSCSTYFVLVAIDFIYYYYTLPSSFHGYRGLENRDRMLEHRHDIYRKQKTANIDADICQATIGHLKWHLGALYRWCTVALLKFQAVYFFKLIRTLFASYELLCTAI